MRGHELQAGHVERQRQQRRGSAGPASRGAPGARGRGPSARATTAPVGALEVRGRWRRRPPRRRRSRTARRRDQPETPRARRRQAAGDDSAAGSHSASRLRVSRSSLPAATSIRFSTKPATAIPPAISARPARAPIRPREQQHRGQHQHGDRERLQHRAPARADKNCGRIWPRRWSSGALRDPAARCRWRSGRSQRQQREPAQPDDADRDQHAPVAAVTDSSQTASGTTTSTA